ncbi:MAG TPA: tetratricopeptide repeat protein [Pyrinomonadaceae bacterium]|nr:tetratricopeptide repeat protein [Pyrinomonadaceae bacterium]
MFDGFHSKRRIVYALGLLAVLLCFQPALAQSDDETDPVKLFEKGQDAHAKMDFKRAIELYDAAIKLSPEFPEAEFQRAMALLSTNHPVEAVAGFNRALSLRPDWAAAYGGFGRALANSGKNDREAERILRRAVELDPKNLRSVDALAELRKKAGDFTDAIKLIRVATSIGGADSQVWRHQAAIEVAAGDVKAAMSSIDQALRIDPGDAGARRDRAEMRIRLGDNDGALADLKLYEASASSLTEFPLGYELAQLYARAGKTDESLRVLDRLPARDNQRPEVIALRAELAGDAESSAEARAALEDLLKQNPKDASLLARLGAAYRRIDPAKSQDYYYRANQIDPTNPKYALGYAAALIQGRKFAEAEPILKRVIAASPDDYTAHANLALALYEMKRFAEAVPEYEWLANAKPEIAATYFFIATAHDNLGEYKQALDAYEKFLAHADPTNNKLEIEKVNLRLPPLRAQIQRGQGVKQKRP